ncbi:MAG: co-chaperone GroES [Candidatus Moranbacteria bacterium]|jgi:chaperonin GroES|nr:co-chaperone GroES [Candidatus Moranbacteria bacterium]MBP9801719.1 co-chaperone GroES [Candidatus Moranbacteria bacterium]
MKKPNIKPLGENVLILPEKLEQKTSAGIFLPDTAREERPQQGRVMAIGESEKIKVAVNQKVIFNRYGGTEVKIGTEEYLLVASKDILAVISLD